MNYGGYFIILTRDVEEVFVESYNPEWTLAWNGNTDIQLCLYIFFAVITYYTNNDTGTMDMLVWKCSEEWFRVIKRKDVFVDEHLSHASTNG